ncbi:MAG: hypothetical protein GXP41_07470 [Chloroflexi bacterium]|nr:hypothetical protein [Chloroflexota bacterium]
MPEEAAPAIAESPPADEIVAAAEEPLPEEAAPATAEPLPVDEAAWEALAESDAEYAPREEDIPPEELYAGEQAFPRAEEDVAAHSESNEGTEPSGDTETPPEGE